MPLGSRLFLTISTNSCRLRTAEHRDVWLPPTQLLSDASPLTLIGCQASEHGHLGARYMTSTIAPRSEAVSITLGGDCIQDVGLLITTSRGKRAST